MARDCGPPVCTTLHGIETSELTPHRATHERIKTALHEKGAGHPGKYQEYFEIFLCRCDGKLLCDHRDKLCPSNPHRRFRIMATASARHVLSFIRCRMWNDRRLVQCRHRSGKCRNIRYLNFRCRMVVGCVIRIKRSFRVPPTLLDFGTPPRRQPLPYAAFFSRDATAMSFTVRR
jgi:hypothetical protein